MRFKIAFLTVLAINVFAFTGYWLIVFLRWQAFWILHRFPGGHQCQKDDAPLMIIIPLFEAIAIGLTIAAGFLVTYLIKSLYEKINKLFPEKQP